MRNLWLITLLLLVSGCTGVSHLLIGRQNLYFDGDRAHSDFFIQGDARRYIKENGDPEFYKWDRLVKQWKTVWVLNMYYGDRVLVFKDNTFFGERETWEEEKMMAHGYYPAGIYIVDRTNSPYKYYSLEKR